MEPFSWEITVGIVAPVGIVAKPERPKIPAPALDGRVVLRCGNIIG